MANVTWTDQRVRARFLTVDNHHVLLESHVGVEYRVRENQILSWRPTQSMFEVGDLVLARGVSRDDWRGIVERVIGDQVVEIETNTGETVVLSDRELELVSDREQPELMKPGPPASDPVVEEINMKAWRESREAT